LRPDSPVSGSPIWLEAERFDSLGGWTLDAQFIDQMGSPYLLAIGLGKPVDDAITTIKLPKPGTYRLWVRCRDWAPDHSPGRFKVLLNGRPGEHVFGKGGMDGWVWEDGGVHDLGGETLEVRLRDLSGWYGRCDCLVLSDDPGFRPPDDLPALAATRARHGGVSPEVSQLGPYDVVVVGGGLAGCVAAVAAARLGCRTALIHNRPVLGGTASTECLVPPVGVWLYNGVSPLDPLETGIIEEIRTSGRQTTDEARVYSGRLEKLCAAEPNLDVHLHTHVTGVDTGDGGTIACVNALEVATGHRLAFPAQVFIDCTGDGGIAAAAGAEFRHGREPRSIYGEDMAPELGDSHTMGCGLKYFFEQRDEPVPFEPPPWARVFEDCSQFTPDRHPRLSLDDWQWRIEIGGLQNTIDDAEEIRDELLRVIFGIWDHVKNRCPQLREQARDHELVRVTHVLAKRESRRILGDYVMAQHDVVDETLLPDRVAFGGWGIDDHPPAGFYHDGPTAAHGYHDRRFSIPFRSLYSKDVPNLMMAGRNISQSHVALAATRVMLTTAVMGQAVGTAAWLCLKQGKMPRQIAAEHLAELQQQLLKDGCHIIDLPNRDPADRAREATVSASSFDADAEPGDSYRPENVIDGFARYEHGAAHSWRPDPRQPLPQWIELDLGSAVPLNAVHLTFQTKALAATAFRVEAEVGDGWGLLAAVSGPQQRRHVLAFDRIGTSRLRVVLVDAPQGAAICQVRVYDEP
jgi:hypothetical protein